jgi:hypothetical protein
VKRHASRGGSEPTPREIREQENRKCGAGLRNPHLAIAEFVSLQSIMQQIRATLEHAIDSHACFQQLCDCFGASLQLAQPSESEVCIAREAVARALGVSTAVADSHHLGSPWRHALVAEVTAQGGDLDTHIAEWLRIGAPSGMLCEILPGRLFPRVECQEVAAEIDVLRADLFDSNRSSFDACFGESTPPGHKQIQRYID